MKKFFLAIALMLCTVMFCGCTTAEMLVKDNADGSVDIYYALNLQVDDLLKDNTISQTEFTSMKSAIETKASELIAKSKSEFRYNIAKAKNNNKITEKESQTIFSQLKIYTGWTENIYAVRFNFATEKAYNVYANFGEGVEIIKSSEESFFVTKYSEKTLNVFARERTLFGGKSAFNYFKEEIDAYLIENFSAEVIAKFPKFEMVYSYLTPISRIHSDADQIVSTTEGTMHSWKISEENSNRLVELYTLTARPFVWYLLALTVCFSFTAIYLVVIYFKKNNNRFDQLN